MQIFMARDLILPELDFLQSGLSEQRASDSTACGAATGIFVTISDGQGVRTW